MASQVSAHADVQSPMASQAPTHANVQSTHPFTCNTCQVAFRSGDLQRTHMQTDWHRYNLKRRVASLPPLSSDIFTEKVLANKASAAATAARAAFEKLCAPCQKTYYSENAYANHLNSQKHRTNMMRAARSPPLDDAASVTGSVLSSAMSLGESLAESDATLNPAPENDVDMSAVVQGVKNTTLDGADDSPATDDDDKSSVATSNKPPADPLLDCLFCNYKSPNFKLNVEHMGRFHGMFVPEKEFLVEPEKLIAYLHDKVHQHHECLKCHKILHTASGIQTHMRDRGHCMIAFESDEELVEVGEFYDFRSSYPDADHFDEIEQDAEDSDASASTVEGGVKLGAKRATVTTTEDDAAISSNEDGEDAGWETDSTVSSVPTDEIGAVPIDRTHRLKNLNKSRHHSHADPRPHKSADGFHSHAHATPVAVYHDEYELHLPTGRTAGHRSLNKYYRQNLRNYPGVAERMENAQRRLAAPNSDEDGDTNMEGEDGGQGRGRGRELMTRANGGTGMIGVSDAKKAEIQAVEKKEQRKAQRAQNNYQAGNEKRGNFQKHFRDHLLQ